MFWNGKSISKRTGCGRMKWFLEDICFPFGSRMVGIACQTATFLMMGLFLLVWWLPIRQWFSSLPGEQSPQVCILKLASLLSAKNLIFSNQRGIFCRTAIFASFIHAIWSWISHLCFRYNLASCPQSHSRILHYVQFWESLWRHRVSVKGNIVMDK